MAVSLGSHIVLACFGVAFPAIIWVVHRRGLRADLPADEQAVALTLAKRWSKVAAVLFAVGAVSGTILSFEMGLLWPELMRTYGDVIGLPFALEGIAFFVEAIFIGIYLYGWGRLPPRVHLATLVPIAVSGVVGTFCILAVNSWMNGPTGFRLVDGEVTDVDPWAAMFNPGVWLQFTHMWTATFMVVGFATAAVYAAGLLRGRDDRHHRLGFTVPFAFATVAALCQPVVGHLLGSRLNANQPAKLAAMELAVETETRSPLVIGGLLIDGERRFGIEIPGLGSLISRGNIDRPVTGLDEFAADERPDDSLVSMVHLSFQAMVGVGFSLIGLGVALLGGPATRPRLAGEPAVPPTRRPRRPGSRARPRAGVDHHRGRPPTVDRARRDAHRRGGHRERLRVGVARRAARRLRRHARGRRPRDALDGAPVARGRGHRPPHPVRPRGRHMSLAEVCAVLLFLGVIGYGVLGGADFGSGFWDLTAGGDEGGGPLRVLIDRVIGPVWEANHVWLIYVVVFLWTGFPDAFAAVMETLFVPLSLAGLGIVARGSAFAFRKFAPTLATARLFGALFALSSVVTPFLLGCVAGAVASGRVPLDGSGDAWTSWTGPTSLVGGTLAVLTCAFLAATFLTAEADRRGDEVLVVACRRRGLGVGVAAGLVAVAGIVPLEDDAPTLFDGLTGRALPAVLFSAAAGGVALWALWQRHFVAARLAAVGAVVAVLVGWGAGQYPWVLVDAVTIDDAAGARATLWGLVLVFGIAAAHGGPVTRLPVLAHPALRLGPPGACAASPSA